MDTEKNTTKAYIIFNLGEEKFALHVLKVREILEMSKITVVPESPAYMRGIVNLRGAVLPVVDTRIKFSLDEQENTRRTRIVVTDISRQGNALTLGIVVDAVTDVVEINDEEIQPPPSVDDYKRAAYVSGVVKRNDDFIMIINIDKVFSREEAQTLADNQAEKVS